MKLEEEKTCTVPEVYKGLAKGLRKKMEIRGGWRRGGWRRRWRRSVIRSLQRIVVPTAAHHGSPLANNDPKPMANAGVGVAHHGDRYDEDEYQHVHRVEAPQDWTVPVAHAPERLVLDAHLDVYLWNASVRV